MSFLQFLKRCFVWALIAAGAVSCISSQAYERISTVFDIPQLQGIKIDGLSDDWKDGGFRVDAFPMLGCGPRPLKDFDVQMRLAWDEGGLLVFVTVHDDVGYEHLTTNSVYRDDCVQLFYADKRGGAEEVVMAIAPGMDPRLPNLRYNLVDRRKNPELKKIPLEIEVARTAIEGGYQMELRLPWKSIGFSAAAGETCGFNIYVNDRDKQWCDLSVAAWYPEWFTVLNTNAMYSLRLAEKPSDPVEVAASMSYVSDKPGQVRIVLSAPADFAGKKVELSGKGKIGYGTFQLRDGRAVATIFGGSRGVESQRPKDALTIITVDKKQVGVLDQELIKDPEGILRYSPELPQPLGSLIPRTMKKLAESTPEKRNKVKIFLYGQSIMAQEWWMDIARELRERYPNADICVMNPSIGGVTTPWLMRVAEADLYPEYPDLVVCHAYETFKNGSLEKFVREIRSRTTAEIMLLNHHPSLSGMGRIAENSTIRAVAYKYGCELVEISDPWSEYLIANERKAQDFRMDGIHLNEFGFQLTSYFVLQYFQYDPAFNNKWSDSILALKPEPDGKGRIKLDFEGNRIDLVAGQLPNGGKAGSAKILIDGKLPSQFPDLYAKTRNKWTADSLWVFPPVWKILSEKPLLIEDWTCRITRLVPPSEKNKKDGYFEFEVEGSKTGKDGKGSSRERFVSNSGRVVIEPDDWRHDEVAENLTFTWKVIPQFLEEYRAPEALDPASEHISVLFQGLNPGKHSLEIVPNGDGELPIRELRAHRPPLSP